MDKIQKAATLADQCVKCGLCLQFCPTFQLSKQENESPRGRVSLIQGMASGKLDSTQNLTDYLDHCLQCRTCERVCPSNIEYGNIIKLAKEHLNTNISLNIPERGRSESKYKSSKNIKLKKSPALLRFIIQTNFRIRTASWLLWVYKKSKLQKLVKIFDYFKINTIEQLDTMLPETLSKPKALENFYPAIGRKQGEVSFFPGCINKIIDLDNCHAAIKLLQLYGFDITLHRQACCGALDELSGDLKKAKHHKAKQANACYSSPSNTSNKQPTYNTPILTLATGCLAHIKLSYQNSLSQKYDDLLSFLSKQPLPENTCFKPLHKTAVIHQPCTQRNALKLENTAEKLLSQIPGLTLSTPSCKTSCCGSAGDYSFKYPESSKQLGSQLADELIDSNPDLLITSNIGCSLQFQAILKQQKRTIKTVHPVDLLAQQIATIEP